MLQQLIHDLLSHTFVDPASPQTQAVSNLFWVGGAVAMFYLAVPTVALLYTMRRFRHRPGQGDPPQVEGNRKLEITWTVIPTITVLVIFVLSIRTMGFAEPVRNADTAQGSDLTVIGRQWWWELRYRSGVVSANEIHIPTHTRWLVSLKSDDVVHGFWVPQIGNQMYVVPGQTNHIWLEADRPGVYEGQCAEFCGAAHAWMLLRVIAQPPAQFAAWQAAQLRHPAPPPGRPATTGPSAASTANVLASRQQPANSSGARTIANGARLFQQLTCSTCHAIAGTGATADVGPDLTHVGSRQTIAAGRLNNTPANMMAWLHNPDKIKQGTHMPNLLLTTDQNKALTAYLESLR